MERYYTDEIDVQIVIASLKNHGIRKIVVSPGTTNHTFVFSIQNDSFFELYSCVDERSAAYMACGLALESKEPVVLSCTGATASRNYFPALTEAFYRKLPILAITSTRTQCQIGNLIDQQIDRSIQPKDTVKMSVQLPFIKDDEDFWDCELKVNKAILELNHHGKGPVHINMPTRYDKSYTCKRLPNVRCIHRYGIEDNLPIIPNDKSIGVFIGSHELMSEDLVLAIDKFCEKHNSLVFCDTTSGYYGKYGVNFYLATAQQKASWKRFQPDIRIDIGEVAALNRIRSVMTWRVNEDGELRDTHKNLINVFEMSEKFFFEYYSVGCDSEMTYYKSCLEYISKLRAKPVKLPFSNVYIASKLYDRIPLNSEMHFGILNSLRSWNIYPVDNKIATYANVGGYGIDGCISTLIGASFINKDKIYFGIFGDLAFFYDLNSLGNRHISNNIRILLINNGIGEEFKTFFNPCNQWGTEINKYVAAEGHFGQKSPYLVKHYAEDLGFIYMSATNKEEFEASYNKFIDEKKSDKPILFEVFTNDEDENEALIKILNVYEDAEGKSKNIARKILGDKGTKLVKELLKK